MQQVPGATPITIKASFAGRKRAYDARMRVALVAAGAWVWSLVLLAFSSIAPGAGLPALAASIVVGAVAALALIVSFRRETARWSVEGESCGAEQSCGKESCSAEGGSCHSRLEREMASKILEMEFERLRLTLRAKYGPDLLFFAFWTVLGSAISLRAATPSIALAAGIVALASLGVLAARVRLSSLVFAR